jgi:hypothetical protein
VGVRGLALAVVRLEVVRVVRERGELEVVPFEHAADAVGIEVLHVDVRDAGVAAPLAARRRPARDLEHLEPLGRRPVGHLLEREIRERGGQQSELHGVTSAHRCSRDERPTASARTFSTWPARKVGYAGASEGPPRATSA